VTAVWFAALAIAVSPSAETSLTMPANARDAKTEASPSSPRVGVPLKDSARAALRRWAQVKDDQAEQAAEEFLILYQELARDRTAGPATRQELRDKVRGRLVKLSGQISRRIDRQERLAAGTARDTTRMQPGQDAILAQRGDLGGRRGMFPGRGFAAPGPAAPGAGPARLRAAGRPGQVPDYGQQLVELIQRTIAPASWDVNGGPGTIQYWRPGRALVVRQTDEIHERIGDVLKQLDRAGR